MRRIVLKSLALPAILPVLPAAAQKPQTPVEVEMYYPVAVGGPITKIVDGMVADFHRETPGIHIRPVYAGNYQDAMTKALTAHRGGTPPQMAVLLCSEIFTLMDEDAIIPIHSLLQNAQEQQWLSSFYPAFMLNSRANGQAWSVPFQRSTNVMYYNKDLFRAAGLNPERAPATWDELVEFAKKLTRRDAGGNVIQWGISIPSTAFGFAMLQVIATANDALLMNPDGTEVYFDRPAVIEALQYWQDLATKNRVMPPGTTDWGTTPKDFLEQKAAIIWTTTGNLANIRANARFPFGVAMMPHLKRGGSPAGGGNFFIFKNASAAQQHAALRFAQWATQPERAADWSIATGYVAVTPAAWQTEKMKQYAAQVPAATVARDQLAVSVAAFSTHDNQRVTKLLNDAIQSVLVGSKTPQQAMKDAQREADRLLRPWQP